MYSIIVKKNGSAIPAPFSNIRSTNNVTVEVTVNEGYRNSYENLNVSIGFSNYTAINNPNVVRTPVNYTNQYSFYPYELNGIDRVQTNYNIIVTVTGLEADTVSEYIPASIYLNYSIQSNTNKLASATLTSGSNTINISRSAFNHQNRASSRTALDGTDTDSFYLSSADASSVITGSFIYGDNIILDGSFINSGIVSIDGYSNNKAKKSLSIGEHTIIIYGENTSVTITPGSDGSISVDGTSSSTSVTLTTIGEHSIAVSLSEATIEYTAPELVLGSLCTPSSTAVIGTLLINHKGLIARITTNNTYSSIKLSSTDEGSNFNVNTPVFTNVSLVPLTSNAEAIQEGKIHIFSNFVPSPRSIASNDLYCTFCRAASSGNYTSYTIEEYYRGGYGMFGRKCRILNTLTYSYNTNASNTTYRPIDDITIGTLTLDGSTIDSNSTVTLTAGTSYTVSVSSAPVTLSAGSGGTITVTRTSSSGSYSSSQSRLEIGQYIVTPNTANATISPMYYWGGVFPNTYRTSDASPAGYSSRSTPKYLIGLRPIYDSSLQKTTYMMVDFGVSLLSYSSNITHYPHMLKIYDYDVLSSDGNLEIPLYQSNLAANAVVHASLIINTYGTFLCFISEVPNSSATHSYATMSASSSGNGSYKLDLSDGNGGYYNIYTYRPQYSLTRLYQIAGTKDYAAKFNSLHETNGDVINDEYFELTSFKPIIYKSTSSGESSSTSPITTSGLCTLNLSFTLKKPLSAGYTNMINHKYIYYNNYGTDLDFIEVYANETSYNSYVKMNINERDGLRIYTSQTLPAGSYTMSFTANDNTFANGYFDTSNIRVVNAPNNVTTYSSSTHGVDVHSAYGEWKNVFIPFDVEATIPQPISTQDSTIYGLYYTSIAYVSNYTQNDVKESGRFQMLGRNPNGSSSDGGAYLENNDPTNTLQLLYHTKPDSQKHLKWGPIAKFGIDFIEAAMNLQDAGSLTGTYSNIFVYYSMSQRMEYDTSHYSAYSYWQDGCYGGSLIGTIFVGTAGDITTGQYSKAATDSSTNNVAVRYSQGWQKKYLNDNTGNNSFSCCSDEKSFVLIGTNRQYWASGSTYYVFYLLRSNNLTSMRYIAIQRPNYNYYYKSLPLKLVYSPFGIMMLFEQISSDNITEIALLSASSSTYTYLCTYDFSTIGRNIDPGTDISTAINNSFTTIGFYNESNPDTVSARMQDVTDYSSLVIKDIAYGSGFFIATTNTKESLFIYDVKSSKPCWERVLISLNWNSYTGNTMGRICYGDGRFIIMNDKGTDGAILTSNALFKLHGSVSLYDYAETINVDTDEYNNVFVQSDVINKIKEESDIITINVSTSNYNYSSSNYDPSFYTLESYTVIIRYSDITTIEQYNIGANISYSDTDEQVTYNNNTYTIYTLKATLKQTGNTSTLQFVIPLTDAEANSLNDYLQNNGYESVMVAGVQTSETLILE